MNQDASTMHGHSEAVFDEMMKLNKGNDMFDVLAPMRLRIHAFLKQKAESLGIKDVKENEHSLPGTELYTRFVHCWEQVGDQTLKAVFHGTAEANVKAICKNGLDPKRRAGLFSVGTLILGVVASVSVGLMCQCRSDSESCFSS